MSEFSTKPNPDQPERCPSIDPHDCLQCTRSIHEDDQCHSGGIAWKKGTPRYVSDRERADAAEAALAEHHKVECCRIHGTHSSPHVRCILR